MYKHAAQRLVLDYEEKNAASQSLSSPKTNLSLGSSVCVVFVILAFAHVDSLSFDVLLNFFDETFQVCLVPG